VARTASDADLRAALIALIRRAGAAVEIANTELYDAMMPHRGTRSAGFVVEQTVAGIRLVLSEDTPQTDQLSGGRTAH
jgi:hypothetical protein